MEDVGKELVGRELKSVSEEDSIQDGEPVIRKRSKRGHGSPIVVPAFINQNAVDGRRTMELM